MHPSRKVLVVSIISALGALPALASGFSFTTGTPDGRMAALSQPASSGKVETETADDFILTDHTLINSATFTGLISAGATTQQIVVEIYRVFPLDSVSPPSGNVPSRNNSPGDNELLDRSLLAGTLSFTTTPLSANFSAANSVVNGINKKPNQNTLGEGPVSGEEVQFNITFSTPIDLTAGHYFFVPQLQLSTGNFLWLSTIGPAQFTGDLQAWIRNADLDPDWLRIGTDIVGGATPPTFDMAFSLNGNVVPEPSTVIFLVTGLGMMSGAVRRKLKM